MTGISPSRTSRSGHNHLSSIKEEEAIISKRIPIPYPQYRTAAIDFSGPVLHRLTPDSINPFAAKLPTQHTDLSGLAPPSGYATEC